MIKELSIKNYKSIVELSITPKKFNLFIGRPNVGKSNILEAISLLGIHNLFSTNTDLSSFLRFKALKDIFNTLNEEVAIASEMHRFSIKNEMGIYNAQFKVLKENEEQIYSNLLIEHSNVNFQLDYSGFSGYDHKYFRSESHLNPIKLYLFKEKFSSKLKEPSFHRSLSSPLGLNLFKVISNNDEVYNELKETMAEYGFKLIELEDQKNVFFIQKEVNGRIRQLPYYLLADTIKRYIFHYAAIHTNENKTILFEEPESHSYPPYIHQLAQNIVASSNQYFIATHSPYLYDVFMKESKPEDLNVYYVDYVEHNTVIKLVDRKVLEDLRDFETDIFFNIETQMR